MVRYGRAVMLLVLVAGMVGGRFEAGWAKDKFEREVETEAVAVQLARDAARGGYALVTTAELKQWIDSGKDMVIIDTMPYEASYKKQHVPSAVPFLFPIPDMDSWDLEATEDRTAADFRALLGPDLDRPVVVYCGFVKCTRSHNGAAWARKLGYRNVYRYSGGIYAWRGAGFPIERAE